MIELFGILFAVVAGFVGGMYLGAAVERDDSFRVKGQWYVSGFWYGVQTARMDRDHHQAMDALEHIGDDIRNQAMEEVWEG